MEVIIEASNMEFEQYNNCNVDIGRVDIDICVPDN